MQGTLQAPAAPSTGKFCYQENKEENSCHDNPKGSWEQLRTGKTEVGILPVLPQATYSVSLSQLNKTSQPLTAGKDKHSEDVQKFR